MSEPGKRRARSALAWSSVLAWSSALFTLLAGTRPAQASGPSLFGHGARSSGLSRADVADADPTSAPLENASLCSAPGLRLRLGYAYGAMAFTLDDRDAGVSDVSGVDLAVQLGAAVTRSLDLGLALAAHIPDTWIAKISFRPATEPQFVLYESALQRTTFDIVAALRYGPLSLGGGVSMGAGVAGDGTRFDLTQDAAGTHADATADVALPYRAAPLVGVRFALGRASIGAAFRGASSIDLRLESSSRIALTENPLNGVTTVRIHGSSGYEPAIFDIGAALLIGAGFTAHAAIAIARNSAAPPPVADVTLDVQLGTVPSQREARFIEPRLRDTLSPRIAVELRRPAVTPPPPSVERGLTPSEDRGRPAGSDPIEEPVWRWALRAGYALSPSPLPKQTGFTSYADATRHAIALGGGYRFGRAFGVDLSASLAAQLHVLAERREEKPNRSLPHATYEVGGHILHGAASLEAAWR